MSYVNFNHDRRIYKETRLNDKKTKIRILNIASAIPIVNGKIIELSPDLYFNPDFYFTAEHYTHVSDYFQAYVKNNFSSVEMYNHSNLIKVNASEAVEFATDFKSHIIEIANDLQLEPSQAAKMFCNELAAKKFLIKPVGISGVIHTCQLTLQSAGSGCYTAYACAASSLSGSTGLGVIASTPLLLVTVPTLFGLSFAATERVFYGTFIGNASGFAKSICLAPMLGCEHLGNHIISPVASMFGLDISFNLTSYVQNGFGIRLKDSRSVIRAAKNPAFWSAIGSWLGKKF